MSELAESSTSRLDASPHGAASSTRADDAEPHSANGASSNVVAVRFDTHRPEPYVVGLTTIFWEPVGHFRNLTPLGSGVNVSWAL